MWRPGPHGRLREQSQTRKYQIYYLYFPEPNLFCFLENYDIFPFPVFCDSHLAKSEKVCGGLETGFTVTKHHPPAPISHLSWALDNFS